MINIVKFAGRNCGLRGQFCCNSTRDTLWFQTHKSQRKIVALVHPFKNIFCMFLGGSRCGSVCVVLVQPSIPKSDQQFQMSQWWVICPDGILPNQPKYFHHMRIAILPWINIPILRLFHSQTKCLWQLLAEPQKNVRASPRWTSYACLKHIQQKKQ